MAAASGLVRVGGRLVVAADDELALATFTPEGADGRWLTLDDAALPLDHGARKAVKPDVEALCVLPDGDLLALGSGATDARTRAWRIRAGARVEPLDLGRLYAELRRTIPDLNLEGAAWADGLWLAQRGNGAARVDALVAVDLDAQRVVRIVPVELGDMAGVPLTLSDLDPRPRGLLAFAAVAEDGASTYLDGACVGAAVGLLDPHTGRVEDRFDLPEPVKVEGLCDDLLVADADDPSRPAPLLRVTR